MTRSIESDTIPYACYPHIMNMNNFELNITSLYQGQGKKWLNELPDNVHKTAQLWNLTNLKPQTRILHGL